MNCSLNLLLASRRVNFKLLMKDFVSTMCALFVTDEKSISLVELQKDTLCATKEFLEMIMELDASKKKADGWHYYKRRRRKVFENPKWKLEIVLQYLTKYISKPLFVPEDQTFLKQMTQKR